MTFSGQLMRETDWSRYALYASESMREPLHIHGCFESVKADIDALLLFGWRQMRVIQVTTDDDKMQHWTSIIGQQAFNSIMGIFCGGVLKCSIPLLPISHLLYFSIQASATNDHECSICSQDFANSFLALILSHLEKLLFSSHFHFLTTHQNKSLLRIRDCLFTLCVAVFVEA